MSAAVKLKPWNAKDARKRGNWSTPAPLFREIELRYSQGGFTLDVAASKSNATCHFFYTKKQDGLRLPWPGRVWCQPPYSDIAPWIRKAYCEVVFRRAQVVVLLLPARVDQAWYHFAKTHGRIVEIKGRVPYDPPRGKKASTPFEASVVVIFEPPLEAHPKRKKGARHV